MASTSAPAKLRPGAGRFLPPDPRVEEPYRFTPQLALRIGVLGALVLAVFGVLFFRLWSLQVLSGAEYLRAAQDNQLRTVRIEAPRGPIFDRYGRVVVQNRPGTAVQLWPADLPDTWRERSAQLRRLGEVLDVPFPRILSRLKRFESDPLTPVVVKEGVREDQVNYLYERQEEFQGVQIVDTFLRDYPFQSLGSHIFGHVGEVTAEQLEQTKLYSLGDKIGQAGVEARYDRYLRGTPGIAQLRVDSIGRPQSDVTPKQNAHEGLALRLTIDIELQQAAERALRHGIDLAHANDCVGCWASDGGALVALDPRNGEVLALASNPPYQSSVFVGRPDPDKLAPLVDQTVAEEENFPALNRATTGLYPPGSTFKPVTALAAMEEHLISPSDLLACIPLYEVAGQVFKNWDPFMSQAMTLPTALGASCDTYFYELGYRFYKLPPERGQPLQAWTRRFGFGSPTGIDVGPEEAGLVPTFAWKQATFTKERFPNTWQIDRLWKPGDSIQLAIGQKDMLVTPLQMTRFYALVANGGKLVTPHIVRDVVQPGANGTPPVVRRRLTPPPAKSVSLDPQALAAVQAGLYKATHSGFGTSTPVFGNFPIPVAGKTGTAEKFVDLEGYSGLVDQSWWCGYAPYDRPEIAVCAVIENGGYGGAAAAPAALKVFEQYFGVQAAATSAVEAD